MLNKVSLSPFLTAFILHSALLKQGPAIYMDANAHMTSSSWSAAFIRAISARVGSEGGSVQRTPFSSLLFPGSDSEAVLYPRSDSRTGGTVGPMLSESLGIRALDMGIPMLSMHSIRAMTGRNDPGYAVKLWEGLYRDGVSVLSEMEGWQ
jgi:aminopeptidase I